MDSRRKRRRAQQEQLGAEYFGITNQHIAIGGAEM